MLTCEGVRVTLPVLLPGCPAQEMTTSLEAVQGDAQPPHAQQPRHTEREEREVWAPSVTPEAALPPSSIFVHSFNYRKYLKLTKLGNLKGVSMGEEVVQSICKSSGGFRGVPFNVFIKEKCVFLRDFAFCLNFYGYQPRWMPHCQLSLKLQKLYKTDWKKCSMWSHWA